MIRTVDFAFTSTNVSLVFIIFYRLYGDIFSAIDLLFMDNFMFSI